jgi:hypothetical protein
MIKTITIDTIIAEILKDIDGAFETAGEKLYIQGYGDHKPIDDDEGRRLLEITDAKTREICAYNEKVRAWHKQFSETGVMRGTHGTFTMVNKEIGVKHD